MRRQSLSRGSRRCRANYPPPPQQTPPLLGTPAAHLLLTSMSNNYGRASKVCSPLLYYMDRPSVIATIYLFTISLFTLFLVLLFVCYYVHPLHRIHRTSPESRASCSHVELFKTYHVAYVNYL